MNICKGDKKCLHLCYCKCIEKICECGHRDHNGICKYVQCECYCTVYNEELDEYIYIECTCGHREHNGNCYLAPNPPCCKPIKCLNFKYCKWLCINDYEMPESPFCIDCNIKMGNFKNVGIIKKCNICFENKNILLVDSNKEICNECLLESNN